MSLKKPASLKLKRREAISFVLELIETNLSEKFTYHTPDHTRSVIKEAENLAKYEGVDERSLELLCVAAAWHDCGYLGGPLNHEEESCHLVMRHLPDFGFNKTQTGKICEIIMATKISNNPEGLLQEIICDADLHYLGTRDYEHIANLLYWELKNFGLINSPDEWIEKQIDFLINHRFHTKTAKNLYDNQKQINLEHLVQSC